MKNGLKLHEWQKARGGNPKAEEEKPWVTPQSCHVCGKVIAGAYGHTTLGDRVVWSCSASCEREVARQRKEFYNGLLDMQSPLPPPVGA